MQHSIMSSLPADANTILEHLPVGVALFEVHTWRLLTANAAYESLLDPVWQQGQAIGHQLSEFFPQAEASGVIALFHQVAQKGTPSQMELSVFSSALLPHDTYWNCALRQVVLLKPCWSFKILPRRSALSSKKRVLCDGKP
jgi:hypothetical protein